MSKGLKRESKGLKQVPKELKIIEWTKTPENAEKLANCFNSRDAMTLGREALTRVLNSLPSGFLNGLKIR